MNLPVAMQVALTLLMLTAAVRLALS